MKKEIQLPDFLPSRYRSWLELYRDLQKTFKEQGISITEETTIKIAEFGTKEEMDLFKKQFGCDVTLYNHFSITLIKARALDEVLSKLPSSEKLRKVRNTAMSGLYNSDQEMFQIFNDLLSILA